MNVLRSLLVLAVALVAMGAAAQDLEVRFHWSECPPLGEYGLVMGSAVQYKVFVSRDGGPEEMAGATTDTFFTLVVPQGQDLKVRVQGVDSLGVASLKSQWSEPLDFGHDGAGVPQVAYLQPNYPNPFNPETTLSYQIPEDLPAGAPVNLAVYNVRGRQVDVLPVERDPGLHQVRWDGRDNRGEPVSSGIYLARLRVGTRVETRKMTLTK